MADDRRPKTTGEKAVEEAEALEALARVSPLLRLFGARGRKVSEVLEHAHGLAVQGRDLAALPRRFNRVLAPRGWIAYERMNADLLRRATELAEAGRLEEAENALADALDPDALRFQLRSMLAIAAFRPRDQLLRLAAADHEAERYHAVIPVVLAQIDGIVAEIVGAGPFQRTERIVAKLVAWDSISAQTGGLPDLISLMASRRFETTTGPLDVPYRHGILHGRDLGYANKLVAAKAWAALFSLREWAIKYERGELEPPPVEPAPSVLATLRQIAHAERQRKVIEAWRPRTGVGPLPEDWKPIANTPEARLVTWLDAWRSRNFVRMASFTQGTPARRDLAFAARLEETFGHRDLVRFHVTHIEDLAAAMSKVTAELSFIDTGGSSPLDRQRPP